jgi:hypothetical protein
MLYITRVMDRGSGTLDTRRFLTYCNSMSNIAGKAYAMNVITPMRSYTAWLNRLFFWLAGLLPRSTAGLQTLSLIHYARWVILKPGDFPRLSPDQPEEDLKYSYMMFFSNFNGSWDQYVDSFSAAIPGGLNKFWTLNIKYPKSVPMLPFHKYITSNQIWTDHYYNAYPMASTNDVKSGQRVKDNLRSFVATVQNARPEEFLEKYNSLLIELQHDLSQMGPRPVVSLSADAVERRLRREDSGTLSFYAK